MTRTLTISPVYLLKSVLIYALCIGVGYLGLLFSIENHNVSLVWPLSGVALTILLMLGRPYWMPILLAEVSLNLLNQTPLFTSCLVGGGNTLAAYISAELLNAYDFQPNFGRVRDVLIFMVVGMIGNSLISASIGSVALYFVLIVPGENFLRAWFTWWLGDAMGVLMVAPVLLIWLRQPLRRISLGKWVEGLVLFAALFCTSWIVFQHGFIAAGFYPLAYLLFPFLVWAALRFNQRMIVTLTAMVSIVAVMGIEEQAGIQMTSVIWNSELFLWLYMATITTTAMLLAATLIEQRTIQSKVVSLEDRFSKAFRFAPVSITISTLDAGRFVDVNDQFCRLSGYQREELIGRTAPELRLWETQADRAQIVSSLQAHGFVAQVETHLRTRAGDLRLGLSSAQILTLEGKRYMLAMFHDITEYRQAQIELEQSEERYRELFEGISDAIFVHKLDGQILDVNEVACVRLGYSRNELLRLKMTTIDTPELAASFPTRMQKLQNLGHSTQVEGDFLARSGQPLQVDLNSKLIHYQGQPAVLAVARDVTERRLAEKKLRESEARYRAVVEDQTELICRYTPDGVLTFVNDAYCRYYGRPRESLIGMNFLPLIHPEDRVRFKEILRSLNAENPVKTSENRTLMADGTIRWHQWTDHAIFDEQGQIIEYQSISQDITELKAMEHERLMTALEREKVKILADFIAAASHDFRTPLSVINTSAYLLNRKAQTDYSDHHYNIIQEQTYYIERLVEGLLTMSRLDRGDIFHFSPLDLNKLIQEVETRIRPQVKQKLLTLALLLDPALPPIEADEEWIYRCIMQLVNNAIQFTDTDGSITIRTTQAAEQVSLEVSDTGSGIDDEDLPYIFDRLYRGEVHRPVGGQGLGLSIAKKIVEGHKGTIEVESQSDSGSTFRVRLPITHVDSNEEPWLLR